MISLCRVIFARSKKSKSCKSSDGVRLLVLQAATVMFDVLNSISAVNKVNLLVAYMICCSDNVLGVKYIKIEQTTINGRTKGIGVFACAGITFYMTPQWGFQSELFVVNGLLLCSQFAFTKLPVHQTYANGACVKVCAMNTSGLNISASWKSWKITLLAILALIYGVRNRICQRLRL